VCEVQGRGTGGIGVGSHASTPAGPRGVKTVDRAVSCAARLGDTVWAALRPAEGCIDCYCPGEGAQSAAACRTAVRPSMAADGGQLTVNRASNTAANLVVSEIVARRAVHIAFRAGNGLTETVPDAAVAALGAFRPAAPVSWHAINTAFGNGTLACLRSEDGARISFRGHASSTGLVAHYTIEPVAALFAVGPLAPIGKSTYFVAIHDGARSGS